MIFSSLILTLMDAEGWYNSPFIIPVAGCAMIGSIAVAGIWSGVRTKEIKSHERLAMIAQGLQPEPEWDQEVLKQATANTPAPTSAPGRPNDGSGARRAGIILCSIGLGLIAFFFVLAIAVRTSQVLSGSAAGILPLAIGLGFLADARMRRRDFDRWMDTVYPRTASYGRVSAADSPIAPPPPPPPAPPAGMTPAQASDWRPLH